MKNGINWEDFSKIEMRVGTIISATNFEEAKKTALKIVVDFGEFGIRKTSAQITKLYTSENIIGKQVIAVVNFPPKQIANFMSECLILGAVEESNLVTERKVSNGTKID